MINDVAADDCVDAKRRGAAGALPPLAEPAPRQRNPLDDAIEIAVVADEREFQPFLHFGNEIGQ